MPSAFIVSQAELLRRTNDTFLVLQNIRDKYAVSSFPSQMSRVKEVWYGYNDRHRDFDSTFSKGLRSISSQDISSKFVDKYRQFGEDNMKEQIRKQRLAASQSLTGSRRVDAIISQIPILPEYMREYKLSTEDINRNKTIVSTGIDRRSMDCVNIDDADKLISRCQSIVRDLDEDIFVTIAALGVVCGRRSIEILKLGRFGPSRRGSYACRFSGAAKKRGCEEQEMDIPLLSKYKYVERCVGHIRSHISIDSLSNSAVNSKYSHKLGDAAKILLDSLDVRFHDLRAIYGMLTHCVFKNTWSINIWLKKILGHDNIDTSVYYSRCKIENCTVRLSEWRERL